MNYLVSPDIPTVCVGFHVTRLLGGISALPRSCAILGCALPCQAFLLCPTHTHIALLSFYACNSTAQLIQVR